MKKLQLFLLENLVWVIFAGFFLVFGLLKPYAFLTLSNFRFLIFSSAALGFLVLAEATALLSGNFDLSVGQMAGFLAMLNAKIITAWLPNTPWYFAIIFIVLLGGLMGAINGTLVGKVRLNPFLVTLAMYMVFRGGTLTVSTLPISKGFPDLYLAVGGDSIAGIPMAIFVLAAGVVILAFVLQSTKFGSHIYAVGSNAEAANMTGINVGNMILFTYIVVGLLVGVAALLFSGFIGSATPGLANDTIFIAFAGAVIGGINLHGGRGKLSGAVGGILLVGTIDAGLTMMYVPPEQVRVYMGILVLAALLINRAKESARDRILTSMA
jgi:ribose/xylose/arabinose/galactoside ABC-type transport system permease subunit